MRALLLFAAMALASIPAHADTCREECAKVYARCRRNCDSSREDFIRDRCLEICAGERKACLHGCEGDS